jgi:DNA-binding HxlR family transcriptional regulator
MAFYGELHDFPLTDLLWFLGSRSKSGWLSLSNETSYIVFTFRRGQLVAARSNDATQRLGQVLVNNGAISEEQLEEALTIQRSSEDPRALGTLLVQHGFLTRERLQSALVAQFGELIFRLLINPTGQFRFDPGIPDLRGEPVNVSVEKEVFDAIRRADEWCVRHMQDAPFRINPSISTATADLIERGDRVFLRELIDGPRTFDQLVKASGHSSEAVLESLTRLQTSGIILIDAAGEAETSQSGESLAAGLVA